MARIFGAFLSAQDAERSLFILFRDPNQLVASGCIDMLPLTLPILQPEVA
jgi:hypothetical protein